MRVPLLLVSVALSCSSSPAPKPSAENQPMPALPAVDAHALRPVKAFDAIADRGQRSQALFLEASRVFLHPRCANCHPDGDVPAQGNEMTRHEPPVLRGADDQGIVGMRCTSCHQDHNLELARVPGAPHWHLAPRVMAWVGKTPHQICEQMKDPGRNGGRNLQQIVDHNAHDELVGWGWYPGHGREAAPGTQQELGQIVAAWVQTGAECPSEGAKP